MALARSQPTPRRLPTGTRHLIPFAVVILLGGVMLASLGAPKTVEAACGSFQSRVDNAKAGSTIKIPKCVFHEEVTVRKKLTINAYGATIDGENKRGHGISILHDDVTINGLTVMRVSGEFAVWTTGVNRFTLRDANVKNSAVVCLSVNGGTGHRILHSRLHGCGKEGYFANGISNSLFKSNSIYHNNKPMKYDPFTEAGGGKVMASRSVTFDHNKVYYNGGPGIWFDNGDVNMVARYNRVRDNAHAGIFFEISSGAKIYGNKVWRNGFAYASWGYGAGITVSSSDRAAVYGNTVAWNARGISVISQSRGPSPHEGNVIHDNTIISANGHFVAGFYDDHGGSLWASGNGNRGYDNRYWIGGSRTTGDRFQWSGFRSTLTAYNATLGERSGKYITVAQRNKILRARDMPTKP